MDSKCSNHDVGYSLRSIQDQYLYVQAVAFDKSLLQKLDFCRNNENKTLLRDYTKCVLSSLSGKSSPTTRLALEQRGQTQLNMLSLQNITNLANMTEGPMARWTDTPLSSGVSSDNSDYGFSGSTNYVYVSSSDASDHEESRPTYNQTSSSVSLPNAYNNASSINDRHRGSVVLRLSPGESDCHMEGNGVKISLMGSRAKRCDRPSQVSAVRQKGRASSHSSDRSSLHSASNSSDLSGRRKQAARLPSGTSHHSPTSSFDSIAPAPISRDDSYTSTMSLSTDSITRSSSYDRPSPEGVSSTTECLDSLCNNPMSWTSNLRGPLSSQGGHERVLADTRPVTARRLSENTGSAVVYSGVEKQESFLCKCCPRKPKRFETQGDLNIHEQAKQYKCLYCKSLFKNKNEASRHANSLHLRRYSWSCVAPADYQTIFHTSTTRAGSDTCGFCGEEFMRSGSPSTLHSRSHVTIPSERDWEVRLLHLQEMHKFGECNHKKSFFRADHFRQHLKHSHARTSGKWINMLEKACMKDESAQAMEITGKDQFVKWSGS